MTDLWRGATCAARLPAQDLDRARSFYRDTLGLAPTEERDGAFRVQLGATEFAVFASTGEPSGTHTQLGIYVDDLDALAADLRGRGATLEPAVPIVVEDNYASKGGGERALWLRDSEGNLIGLGELTGAAPRSAAAPEPAWIDVTAVDAAASREFYAAAFGWSVTVDEALGYGLVAGADGGPVGGIGQAGDGPHPVGVVAYLPVTGLGATLEAVAGAGGEVVVAPWAIPGLGQMAVVADPEGNRIGLMAS